MAAERLKRAPTMTTEEYLLREILRVLENIYLQLVRVNENR